MQKPLKYLKNILFGKEKNKKLFNTNFYLSTKGIEKIRLTLSEITKLDFSSIHFCPITVYESFVKIQYFRNKWSSIVYDNSTKSRDVSKLAFTSGKSTDQNMCKTHTLRAIKKAMHEI